MGMDLGSVYSSLEFRLDSFEAGISKALEGFYKLQLGTANASKLMDKSVFTAVDNIDKSYKLLEMSGQRTGLSMLNNSKYVETLKEKVSLFDKEIAKTDSTLEKLVSEFGKGSKEVQNYQSHILDLKLKQAELNKEIEKSGTLSGKLENLNSSLEATERKFEGFTQVGQRISGLGQTLTMGVTTPLLGIGVAAAKVGMDFDSQMSRVKAISGATGEEFKALDDQALQLGADTAFSSKQAAEGMENLASAGFTTVEIMSAMPGMLDLAASSGENLATSADIAASTLRGFGLEASQAGHVADVLAKNAGATNAAVVDTGEAMKYIAPVARAMGLSLEEVTSAIGLMANAGIKGSQAGTTLRGSLAMLASPSKESAKLMESIGFNAFDAHGKLLPLNQIVANLQASTSKLTDKQKESAIATIFGTEAMSGMLTLVQAGPQQLNDLTTSLKTSNGAAKEMATTMQDNAKASVEQMMGSLETAGIKIERALAPSIKKTADFVGNLADKFSQLSPETQDNIIKFGLLTAAVGPCVLSISKLIESVVTIQKGFQLMKSLFFVEKIVETGAAASTAASSIGLLGGAARIATLAFNPWVLGTLAAGFGVYKLAQYLRKDSVPAVDLFADRVTNTTKVVKDGFGGMVTVSQKDVTKISDSTKKAVSAYIKMDNDAKKSLADLYANNTKITTSTVNGMVGKYNEMGAKIKAGMDKHYNSQYQTMQQFFQKSNTLTNAEEAKALAGLQKDNADKKEQIDQYNNQIYQIMLTASNNHRALTIDEQQQINSIQEKMKELAVQSLSENEIEAKVIMDRIKEYGTRITAEQASEVIKNAEKQRVESVDKANRQFEETKAAIETMQKTVPGFTQEMADKLIADAERQRKESIDKANNLKTDVVKHITDMNRDVGDSVNTTTGDVLTNWDKLKNWWDNWHPLAKTFSFIEQHFQNNTTGSVGTGNGLGGMSAVPGGYATGTTNARRGFNLVGEEGPELMWFEGGETVLNNKDTNNLLSKLSSNTGYSSAEIWGRDMSQGLADGINNNQNKVQNAALSLANSIHRLLHFSVPDEGPLSDADTYGSDFMQLLADTMEQNSDKPAEAAKKVADLVSEKIKSIKDVLSRDVKDLNSQLSELNKDEEVALRGVKGPKRYAIQDEYDEKRKAIKDEIELRKDQANKEIEEIGRIGKASKEELQKELSDKKTFINSVSNLQKQLVDALKDKYQEEEKAQEDSINSQLENLDKWKEANLQSIDDIYNAKIKALDNETDAQVNVLQSQIDLLDKQKNDSERADQDKEEVYTIETLKAQIAIEEDPKDKLKLQEELAKAVADREKRLRKEAVQDAKDSLEKQINNIKESASKKKSVWQEEQESQKQSIENTYELSKENLQNQLEDIKTFYANKLKEANLNADAEKMIIDKNQKDIVALLTKYSTAYKATGLTLGQSLYEGIKSWTDKIQDTISSIISQINAVQSKISSASSSITTNIPRKMHSGGPVGSIPLASDEVLRILQDGEFVLSRNAVSALVSIGQMKTASNTAATIQIDIHGNTFKDGTDVGNKIVDALRRAGL